LVLQLLKKKTAGIKKPYHLATMIKLKLLGSSILMATTLKRYATYNGNIIVFCNSTTHGSGRLLFDCCVYQNVY